LYLALVECKLFAGPGADEIPNSFLRAMGEPLV
jgi:hypothetical protein